MNYFKKILIYIFYFPLKVKEFMIFWIILYTTFNL